MTRLQEVFKQQNTAMGGAARSAGVPNGPINDIAQVFESRR
jgi:hypothetical protein